MPAALTALVERLRHLDWRTAPIHLGTLTAFLLIPTWIRLPAYPPGLPQYYTLRFVLFWVLAATVLWWLGAGLPGFRALLKGERRLVALALLALALWALLSVGWGFARDLDRQIARAAGPNAAAQFALVSLFAVMLLCVPPRSQAVIAALAVGLAWNSTLALMQTAQQGTFAMTALGEFDRRVNDGIASVLQAGNTRWFRPYGLLPHPNMLAGALVIALLALLPWVFGERARDGREAVLLVLSALLPLPYALLPEGARPAPELALLALLLLAALLARRHGDALAGSVLALAGLWALLLTFSRSAWGALLAGGLATLPFLFRLRLGQPGMRRRLLVLGALVIICGAAFALTYAPLLAARAGVGAESLEMRSIADRIVYTEQALQAIGESPVQGVGMGNFAWWSAYHMNPAYDLLGDNVHNVYLQVWAELGVAGLALFGLALLAALIVFWRRWRRGLVAGEQVVLAGVVVSLAALGLFDHYPWTQLPFQVAWWGCLAAALGGAPAKMRAAKARIAPG